MAALSRFVSRSVEEVPSILQGVEATQELLVDGRVSESIQRVEAVPWDNSAFDQASPNRRAIPLLDRILTY